MGAVQHEMDAVGQRLVDGLDPTARRFCKNQPRVTIVGLRIQPELLRLVAELDQAGKQGLIIAGKSSAAIDQLPEVLEQFWRRVFREDSKLRGVDDVY